MRPLRPLLVLFASGCGLGNGAPEIVDMTLTPRQLGPGDVLEVVVEVADPEGADDLVSAKLWSGGSLLALLESPGAAGTFSAVIPWDELDAALGLEFEDDLELELRAHVMDTRGRRVVESGWVTLTCDGAAYCDGQCVVLERSEEHCGACGESCPIGWSCDDGRCKAAPGWTPCEEESGTTVDCDATCREAGLVCGDTCGAPHEGVEVVYAPSRTVCEEGGEGRHSVNVVGGDCSVEVLEPPPVWFACCCVDG